MKKFVIEKSLPLVGDIEISGSKNAALPIIFSTLITRGVSEIKNVPDIGDVAVALELTEGLGAKIRRRGNTLYIDTRSLKYSPPSGALISKIRASTYLIGGCLSRFGMCPLCSFGGCNFSKRPIDMHLYAASQLGAAVYEDFVTAEKLVGGEIIFDKPSVGATVNAIILAASAKGETQIQGHAREPHVAALVDFLISAGADIQFTDKEIRIRGRELSGGKITVIGDMIEAGTYLTAGLMTEGCVRVKGVSEESLSPFLDLLSAMGAEIIKDSVGISVKAKKTLSYGEVIAAPYPAFPTDLQPIVAPLFAKNSGGRIEDRVWQGRFGYLSSLAAFGVKYSAENSIATISPSTLRGARVSSPDLRGGMACILAALSAKGRSVVSSAETVLRGYENPVKKLRALGAEIKIEV